MKKDISSVNMSRMYDTGGFGDTYDQGQFGRSLEGNDDLDGVGSPSKPHEFRVNTYGMHRDELENLGLDLADMDLKYRDWSNADSELSAFTT